MRARAVAGDALAILVLLVAIAGVFATQRRNAGFSAGHHGWVSAHGLAIAAKAVPGSGFLGYSVRVEQPKGVLHLRYFDRYPVFFSALTHQILELGSPDLSTRILRARCLMNAVFCLTMLAVYALLRVVGWRPAKALTATLLSLSGTYHLAYKDMFHFDQPALLGMVLVWIGIALYERDGRRTVYPLAAVAVCSGRGAASLGAVLAWLACQTAATLRRHRAGGETFSLVGALSRLEALRLLLACVALVAGLLAFNVVMESRQTGEPLGRTSIVASAAKRLGFSEDFDVLYPRELAWPSVVAMQAERLAIALTPALAGVKVDPRGDGGRLGPGSGFVAATLILSAALALAALFRRGGRATASEGLGGASLSRLQRRMLVVMALSGPLWLLGIRRLAQFHDYTAMYDLGTVLAIDLLALSWIPDRFAGIAAAAALAVFLGGSVEVNRRDGLAMLVANVETQDLERVAAVLPPDARLHVDGGWGVLIPGVPYALGFYLPGATLVEDLRRADYVLSRRKIGSGGLTPRNRRLFVYDRRRRPDEAG